MSNQLTRRDHYIIAALQGLLAADTELDMSAGEIAKLAVKQADIAMAAAGEAEPSKPENTKWFLVICDSPGVDTIVGLFMAGTEKDAATKAASKWNLSYNDELTVTDISSVTDGWTWCPCP